ncbi:putative anthocyanidin reductase [Pistacia vera]|uniref:putative anthocyanidin reductase n=1 Tax=Pistacia vera TaxID=55513 RepID=UPI001263DE9F|nr:putative anthocyanidin reductase [Pistacia vera]
MEKRNCKVCVTGGAGYVGSWLVKKLLEKGYTVHATLRNLDDRSKVNFLKSFPDADTRLLLFEADLYDPDKFEFAIQGCEFVFHVATPFRHTDGSQFKNMTEATIAAAKSIAKSCIRSGTVKRLIYTSSMISASPLTHDGTSFKDCIDETCWTPLNLSFTNDNLSIMEYRHSKIQTEKEMLSYGSNTDGDRLEVVTLDIGLVGGETLLSYTPSTVAMYISQLTNSKHLYQALRFTEDLLGKIPMVHVDDVCEAHIFCMENPSINGRFLCASSYVSSAQIANYYQQNYPEFHFNQEYLDGPKREIIWGGTKLIEKGFEYKYDTKMILDGSIECARRTGGLNQ